MALPTGTRLGPYEIVAPLGAGGMGEVYKARDTRLGRTVALKLLPTSAVGDPEVRERFKREGEAIAAVNDPHICALYDIDCHGDHDVLVMEYVEGETLAEVLGRGPLPFQEAAPIAIQIASALDAAHRAGVVHRDLKPSNIMLARTGAKVLDFGIAKRQSPAAHSADEATRAAALTRAGSVVGTLNYMAPEQLQGLDVDARADLFAFGAVLFEMLTGRTAAQASSDLVVPAPPSVAWLIRRCLEKDRAARWQSAHDAAAVLRAALNEPAHAAAPPRTARRMLGLSAALIAALALGAALASWFGAPAAAPDRVSRLSVVAPPGAAFTAIDVSGAPQFVLSPDGEQLAFVASAPGSPSRLWVRSLTTGAARVLDGTDNAASPFWSPDSRGVGFLTPGQLKTIDLSSGRVQIVASVTYNVNSGSWGPDGILYAGGDADAIHFAPSAAGSPRRVTNVNRSDGHIEHRHPQFLPDGRHFLYYVTSARRDAAGVYFGSIDGLEGRLILAAPAEAHFIAPHWLFFERGGSLVVQRFDAANGAVAGEPIVLPDRVMALPAPSKLMMSGSAAGVLALWDGGRAPSVLEWVDRSGRLGPAIGAERALYHSPSISPDGQRVLVTRIARASEPGAIWSVAFGSGRQTRLTFNSGLGARGVWSPDGERIAFGVLEEGQARLFTKPASGAGADEPLQLDPGRHYAVFPTQWSPKGDRILYQATGAQGWDLWSVDLTTHTSEALAQGPGNQTNGRVSPNGRWLAYGSDESGAWQIYVQPFPAGSGKWQVSESSGSQPIWRADGRELYYLDATGLLMVATVRDEPSFEIVDRQRLFRVHVQPPLAPYPANYSVTPDGQRFLINRIDDEAPSTPITVIVNWHELVR